MILRLINNKNLFFIINNAYFFSLFFLSYLILKLFWKNFKKYSYLFFRLRKNSFTNYEFDKFTLKSLFY